MQVAMVGAVENRQVRVIFMAMIAAIALSLYLTEISFVAQIGNNIGPFEVASAALFVSVLTYFWRYRLLIHWNFVIVLILIVFVMAIVSLLRISAGLDPKAITFRITQTIMLGYMMAFLLSLYNFILLRREHLIYLLRFIAIAATVAGMWVILDNIRNPGNVNAAGPFRTRSHGGIYMLTTFWILLFYRFWPTLSRNERWLVTVAMGFALYPIATSGRRSTYIALAAGWALLPASVFLARGRGRFGIIQLVGLALLFMMFLYLVGSQYMTQLAFFKERVALVDDRLELATAITDDEGDVGDNFILTQREGALLAAAEYPITGIGWGAFYRSKYDPTNHEFHGTPLRFLAELGIPGFALYLLWMGYLIVGSARLFLRARGTPYQNGALVFCVCFISLSISHFYNRSVTERTFWVAMVVFMVYEATLLNKPTPIPVKRGQKLGVSRALGQAT